MRVVRIVLKGIGYIFLLWLVLTLWNIFSPLFLPDPEPGSSNPVSVQQALREMAEARRTGGPEAEAAYREQYERSRPFDNALVIYYILPLLLVWLLRAVGRARQVSPLSIVGTLALLWLAAVVLIQAGFLIAPHAGVIGETIVTGLSYLSERDYWRVVGLVLGMLAVLALRTPGFIVTALLTGPRLLDRTLIELFNDEDGWLAQRHGPGAAQAGHAAAVLGLAGLSALVLWRACDGIDGSGTPDTFALVARGVAVAFGAYLMIRSHLRHGQDDSVPASRDEDRDEEGRIPEHQPFRPPLQRN